ncbi:MAG: sensor histidine kinase [Acidimicrobiia bacterium]
MHVLSRPPAPVVDYPAIRQAYHRVRALAAGSALTIGILSILTGRWAGESWLLALAVLVLGQALFRLRRPDKSPLASLALDGAVVTVAILFRGLPVASAPVVFAFLVTDAFLLLDLRRAFGMTLYLVTAEIVSITAPLTLQIVPVPEPQATIWIVLVGVLGIAGTAWLFTAADRRVDEVREAERAALEAERKAGLMKNEFVAMVSHELRTPLTSIAGFSETLREAWRQAPPHEIDEFLDIITDQARHLSRVVEDILIIPRLEAGRLRFDPRLFELRPVAYRIADVLFPTGGAKEATVAIPGGVMVWADEDRVREVIRNLLENALKYGGDQVVVQGSPVGDKYVVVVSDNGPGVPQAHQQRIFDHFEQLSKGDGRRETGIGLGLPIARRLVRAMGGELWFEPRFPTGSRFCFTVDLQPPLPEPAEPSENQVGTVPSYVPSPSVS